MILRLVGLCINKTLKNVVRTMSDKFICANHILFFWGGMIQNITIQNWRKAT